MTGQVARGPIPLPQMSIDRRSAVIEIEYACVLKTRIGLELRRAEAGVLICKQLRKIGKVRWRAATATARLELHGDADRFPEALVRIASELEILARKSITGRQMLSLLPISNAERLVWTSGGRLPRAGEALIRRGQVVAVPLYSMVLVERLIACPAIVARWRERDLSGNAIGAYVHPMSGAGARRSVATG